MTSKVDEIQLAQLSGEREHEGQPREEDIRRASFKDNRGFYGSYDSDSKASKSQEVKFQKLSDEQIESADIK